MLAKEVRTLALAYMAMSLASLILHVKIHDPFASLFNVIPAVFCLANLLVIPFVLGHPQTAPWGYLFAWATVLTGTVGMAYFSIVNWYGPVTAETVIFNSTLADILILWVRVPLAGAILRLHRQLPPAEGGRECRA